MYRSYKNFNLDVFNNTLNMELHSIGNNSSFTLFEKKFPRFLNKQAPLKSKLLWCNNNAFMSKESKKSVILRTKLKDIFSKKGPMKAGVNISANVTYA